MTNHTIEHFLEEPHADGYLLLSAVFNVPGNMLTTSQQAKERGSVAAGMLAYGISMFIFAFNTIFLEKASDMMSEIACGTATRKPYEWLSRSLLSPFY